MSQRNNPNKFSSDPNNCGILTFDSKDGRKPYDSEKKTIPLNCGQGGTPPNFLPNLRIETATNCQGCNFDIKMGPPLLPTNCEICASGPKGLTKGSVIKIEKPPNGFQVNSNNCSASNLCVCVDDNFAKCMDEINAMIANNKMGKSDCLDLCAEIDSFNYDSPPKKSVCPSQPTSQAAVEEFRKVIEEVWEKACQNIEEAANNIATDLDQDNKKFCEMCMKALQNSDYVDLETYKKFLDIICTQNDNQTKICCNNLNRDVNYSVDGYLINENLSKDNNASTKKSIMSAILEKDSNNIEPGSINNVRESLPRIVEERNSRENNQIRESESRKSSKSESKSKASAQKNLLSSESIEENYRKFSSTGVSKTQTRESNKRSSRKNSLSKASKTEETQTRESIKRNSRKDSSPRVSKTEETQTSEPIKRNSRKFISPGASNTAEPQSRESIRSSRKDSLPRVSNTEDTLTRESIKKSSKKDSSPRVSKTEETQTRKSKKNSSRKDSLPKESNTEETQTRESKKKKVPTATLR